MTEEEAKTKWCPHAIASHTNPRQHNGEVWLHNCIGSACMAWRWEGDKTNGDIVEERFIGAGEQYPTAPPGYRWRTGAKDVGHGPRPIALFARIGYCGLAGKP